MAGHVTLFLCGDVMTGRGIDQILPHPGDARLYEPFVPSATVYVALAEKAHGPIPRPVDFSYVWGDALAELDRRRPAARLINLETAITSSDAPEPKGINYKMAPANGPVLTAAGIDCCTLANNHVLDWGIAGLLDTLEKLDSLNIRYVGAGRDLKEARAPAILPIPGGGRVLIFAFGSTTSGIPASWAATEQRPGINLLPDLSDRTVRDVARQIAAPRMADDIVVTSIHWGANWGYEIDDEYRAFARGLIDLAGVDVVHGHSSHHAKAMEVYRNRLVLYGCGDFLNDYEGIGGQEMFRGDLALMYFPTIDTARGTLSRLDMVPLRIRHMRLARASRTDADWLRDVLGRDGARLNTRVRLGADNVLTLDWLDGPPHDRP